MRSERLRFSGSIAVALAALLALTAACGGQSEAERLARAAKTLASAREQVARAREDVASKQTSADQVNGALEAARVRLAEADEKLQAAESSDDLRVSDATLFRAVQQRLLEDRALKDVAVQANVTQGTVVLSGKVPSDKVRDHALELARGTPGVANVESQLEVAPQP